MTKNTSRSLFDDLFHHFDQHPKSFLFAILLSVGLYYSTLTIFIGLLVWFVLGCSDKPYWIAVILLAFFLIVIEGFVFSVKPFVLISWNHYFYRALWQSDWSSFPWMYFVVIHAPYGLSVGGGLRAMTQWRSGLHHELRRVGQGKLNNKKPYVSPKKLAKKMSQLASDSVGKNILFGLDRTTASPVYLSEDDANLHTLIVGTTGSGKTTTLTHFVAHAMRRQFPSCYVDGKGDVVLMNRMRKFAQQHHIPFYAFSMIGNSQHYNPIAFGGFTSKKDRLIELRHWSEDHYRKIAEGYLQTVFATLERLQLPVDLTHLAHYLDPNTLCQLAREKKDTALMDRMERLESDYRDVRSLICEIQNLVHSEIGHLFRTKENHTIELSKAFSEKAIVYFCLQPLAFPAYADTLGKLIMNDLKAYLASRLTEAIQQPLLAIFDEFSVFAGEQVIHLINQGRSAGAHIVLATQSLSDIERKGGEALLGQILNNVNNYIIQRQNYPKDAEALADIIGTQTGFEVTSQLNTQDLIPNTGTVRQSRQFIVHPDEIKRLGLGEAILVNKQRFSMWRVLIKNAIL